MTRKLYVYQIFAETVVGEEAGCAPDGTEVVKSEESELFEVAGAGGEAEFELAELAAAKAAAADIDPTKPCNEVGTGNPNG